MGLFSRGFVEVGIDFCVPNPWYSQDSPESLVVFSVVDVSFVDDSLFPIVAEAKHMLEALRHGLSIVEMSFAMHGLVINTSAGKTEVLLDYAGPGAEALQEEVVHTCNSTIVYQGVQGSSSVSAVNVYQHVGTRRLCASR